MNNLITLLEENFVNANAFRYTTDLGRSFWRKAAITFAEKILQDISDMRLAGEEADNYVDFCIEEMTPNAI